MRFTTALLLDQIGAEAVTQLTDNRLAWLRGAAQTVEKSFSPSKIACARWSLGDGSTFPGGVWEMDLSPHSSTKRTNGH